MIEAAEAEGAIEPGQTILEPTSGNTGIALAMICRRKGYPLKVVMPDNVTEERTQLLRCTGPRSSTPRGPRAPTARSRWRWRWPQEPGFYMPYQYGNEANPLAHYNGTAVEILEELDEVDRLRRRPRHRRHPDGQRPPPQGGRPGDADRRRRADAGRAGPGPALPRRRLHPADHRHLPARPQDHGLQPRRDRLDQEAARRGGRLRRRLRRRDRPRSPPASPASSTPATSSS